MKTESLPSHVYNIYLKPNTPAINVYTHILEWKSVYKNEILRGKKKLKDHNLIFPTINTNLLAHTAENISSKTMVKLINEMAEAARVSNAGKFTTHCFCCGSAQYRFMFAPLEQQWTLAHVRWWGGWALREKV
jgi:hypothetical protein